MSSAHLGSTLIPFSRLLLSSAILVSATPALAQEASSDTESVETVVVTASGREQAVIDAPASVSVIDREQLLQRAYRDVTDALSDLPGVIITGGEAGGDNADISLRGMGASYTLILVDGKRLSGRASRPNSDGPGEEQNWLPPVEAIERIELVRGPMSTLYGSDAIGGVINIITRKVPAQWSGSVQVDAILQESSESGDVNQGNFHLSGPLVEDTLSLQLYGRKYRRDEDQILNGYSQRDVESVTGRLAFTPNSRHQVLLETGLTEQRQIALMGKSAPTEGCRGGCSDSENEYNRDYLSLTHRGELASGTVNSFVQREVTENISRQMEIANTVAKSSYVTDLGAHTVSIGVDYQAEELDDQTSNQVSDRTTIEGERWAVFLEDEWSLLDGFALTAGARLDDDENYGSKISPRLYGVWKLDGHWTLKGGVSTGYRAPSLREITPDWGQVSRGGNIYGNPDLEPEVSVNQELALHYQGEGGFHSGLTLFNNDFEDKITRVVCPLERCDAGPNQFGSDPTYRVNVDKAVTRGVEVSATVPVSETFRLDASYTFTDSEQKTGEYKGEPLNQLPKHLASVSADWQATDNTNSWLRVTYRGEESQPTTGPSQGALIAPSYTFVDVGMNYALSTSTKLKAGIYNLADESVTYDEYGFVADGRRYWLGLSYRF
ncbi:ligand-gated channel protein [Microbulbifer celer]|uniref:Ligand-gated channel protein n=1 Tax=Microbulbifer celer TaxID=435905 RepID=A0ABW3UF10_9GAMM|nr:ligand-gated channel protein [Microbulbifer celer]UFN59176.1 ligand-gated channel protein [Microbulbifer celer]